MKAQALRLSTAGPEPASERLVEWDDPVRAAQFVEWLQRQLPARPPQPRASPDDSP